MNFWDGWFLNAIDENLILLLKTGFHSTTEKKIIKIRERELLKLNWFFKRLLAIELRSERNLQKKAFWTLFNFFLLLCIVPSISF